MARGVGKQIQKSVSAICRAFEWSCPRKWYVNLWVLARRIFSNILKHFWTLLVAGFKNAADMWLENYSDSETFAEDVDKLWDQIRPLYEQLHAYVRRQLRKQYGESKIGKNDPIPAHLLGNMWAQRWANILSFTTPYPEKQSVDVTDTMIAKVCWKRLNYRVNGFSNTCSSRRLELHGASNVQRVGKLLYISDIAFHDWKVLG